MMHIFALVFRVSSFLLIQLYTRPYHLLFTSDYVLFNFSGQRSDVGFCDFVFVLKQADFYFVNNMNLVKFYVLQDDFLD